MSEFLNRIAMILTLKCDQASRLMSDSLDRKLTWHERLALRGHLLACQVCPILHRQIKMVGRLSRMDEPAPSHHSLSDERKQQIKDALARQK